MSQLTPEERERCDAALAEARVALSRVFDSFVVCCRYEDLTVHSSIITDYHGAYSDVVGLAQIALWRFQEREHNNVESDQ
jgi:hypothetical protein